MIRELLYTTQVKNGAGKQYEAVVSEGIGMMRCCPEIYDSLDDAMQTEPKYRLIRSGLKEGVTGSRKMKRELKNRRNKVRGIKKKTIGK